jgi:pyruvate ferredoxin oxidoreductase gamma subunit
MKEIRIHGRGGQGSLVLAQFMAIAALEDGKFGQAFPYLGGGGERKGKAIEAFCRLNSEAIRIRCKVDEPDYVIVQDATIIDEADVTKGLKDSGLLLINTDRAPDELGLEGQFRLITFSADGLAREILGRPIMNTALLGAFSAVTGEFSLESVLKAVRQKFQGELAEKNARVVEESFARLTEARA